MKEHKRPKSRTDHLNSGSSAMNSQRSAHSYLVYFVRGSCSDDFSVSKSRVQCFRLYSTRKRRSPKKHNFFSFITWPQSQSVHKAVSLQPEKFKKKKIRKSNKSVTNYRVQKSSEKTNLMFFENGNSYYSLLLPGNNCLFFFLSKSASNFILEINIFINYRKVLHLPLQRKALLIQVNYYAREHHSA